jgi:hypothetical protein
MVPLKILLIASEQITPAFSNSGKENERLPQISSFSSADFQGFFGDRRAFASSHDLVMVQLPRPDEPGYNGCLSALQSLHYFNEVPILAVLPLPSGVIEARTIPFVCGDFDLTEARGASGIFGALRANPSPFYLHAQRVAAEATPQQTIQFDEGSRIITNPANGKTKPIAPVHAALLRLLADGKVYGNNSLVYAMRMSADSTTGRQKRWQNIYDPIERKDYSLLNTQISLLHDAIAEVLGVEKADFKPIQNMYGCARQLSGISIEIARKDVAGTDNGIAPRDARP